jgi:hypothetical protein
MIFDDTDITRLIDRIDTNWSEFQQAYAGLSEARMLEPGVSGDWSVRDILAHVAVWDALVLSVLPSILETGRHPEHDEANADLDAFNARMTEETRPLTIDEVRRVLEANHQRLLDYLQGVPSDAVATNDAFRERLAADTWNHYPEHAEAIRRWRHRLG